MARSRFGGFCECGDHAWAVLTKGLVTLVSPQDAHHIQHYTWYAASTGGKTIYAMRRIWAENNRPIYLHREIMAPNPPDVVDHKYWDGTDNRRHKIRVVTKSVNSQNMRPSKRNKSGVPGVRLRHTGTWSAYLAVKSKQIWVGSFPTKDAAIAALNEAKIRHHEEAVTK